MKEDKNGDASIAPRLLSGLRTQLIAMVVATLLPAVLGTSYIATQNYRDRRVGVQADAQRLVRMAAADHERRIAMAHRLLLASAEIAEFRTRDGAPCPTSLGHFIAGETAYNGLALIDRQGLRLCAWPVAGEALSSADIALARQAIETRQLAIGGYRLRPDSGNSEMHLAYPVAAAPGRTPAALVLSLDIAYLGEVIRRIGLPDGAAIAIWSEGGQLLYRYPAPEKWVGKNMAHTPVAKNILGKTSEGVTEATGLDGVPRLFAYTPLRLFNSSEVAYLHIGIPTAVAYAGIVRTLAQVFVGLTLAMIIVLALAAWGANAMIIRPITTLVAATRRFGSGDFGSRCAVSKMTGEIGALGNAFNDMAQRIEEHQLELENLKYALDQHAIVSIADATGKLIYLNDQFCTISGYKRDELIGNSHRIIKSDRHPKGFYTHLWDTISSGSVWRGDICIRRKDASHHWLASTIVPIVGPDGKVNRYITIRTDITPLKILEETLRRSETKFRSLAETVSAAVVVHRGGKLLYVNRYAELLTGYSNDELLDMKFYEFAHPDWHRKLLSLWEARQRGEPVPARYEFRGNTKDGQERWVEVSGCLTEFDGKPAALITSIDITERKLAEDALRNAHDELEDLVERRTEQLAQAKAALEEDVVRREKIAAELITRNAELTDLNRLLSEAQNQLLQSEKLASIGQLAAGVAHEINNPIGYVQSNLSSLENYLQDLLAMLSAYESAEAEISLASPALEARLRQRKDTLDIDFIKSDLPNLMNESREGIQRVKKIVQDLKDFSRVDSTMDWAPTDLHQCLESTLNIVFNEIKYKADVVKEYGALPEVECLPSQINQVFMNLLVNAAHAIDGPRGTITVRTGVEEEQAWIEIADTGKGITPENLKRIFEPFFTTKAVGKGTGLGLSLSYGIVQKHHGHIIVSSEVGRGTTFRVTLPIKQAQTSDLC